VSAVTLQRAFSESSRAVRVFYVGPTGSIELGKKDDLQSSLVSDEAIPAFIPPQPAVQKHEPRGPALPVLARDDQHQSRHNPTSSLFGIKASTEFLADAQVPNLAEGQTGLPPISHSVHEESNRISTRKLSDKSVSQPREELMRGYMAAPQASSFLETALSTVQKGELQW
jgi:hypothetical protein